MRVIVTRPAGEAGRWLDALRARGFDAIALPLMAITPVLDASVLRAAWRNVARARAVMFVSGNAVRHFFAAQPSGDPWPDTTRAWATGPGTREALLQAGVDAALVDSPPASATQFDSETLWRQVAVQVCPGDLALIVRGGDEQGASKGRDWLADQLAAAGAKVELVVAYRRGAPEFSPEQLLIASNAIDTGDVWLFSSSQAISHLRAALPQQDWSRARAVATHVRIADAARRAGFGVVCESRPAMDAVVAALESFR
ncbi:MAG: uroporphyrinogen-III synthase [Ramlibacter sp.]|jgi:uroporphyrinogen-III synthase|nr:uroporphyrinogen-III synthase [Ramlibacter sp.]